MPENFLYRLDMICQPGDYDRLTGLLAMDANHGWEEKSLPTGEYVFSVHAGESAWLEGLRGKALDLAPQIAAEIQAIPDRPWHEAWKEYFTPIECGERFLVLPPWLDTIPAPGRQKILIEPECAFGTGHHATTTLCLRALDDLLAANDLKSGDSFLDLGCGSGILGIGAALSGLKGCGVDIDDLAMANANKNRELNQVQELVLLSGGIESVRGRQFNLIMANILATPLIDMARSVTDSLLPGGLLILSGILDIQAQKVAQAYESAGLILCRTLDDGEWRALIMRRP